MADVIYDRALEHVARGAIDFDTDTFKCMLVTSAYTEDKAAHDFRNDVTNEITGTGYTAGGVTVTATVSLDTTNHRLNVTFSPATWTGATLTARKAIIYKFRGGASSADEILMCRDFGSDISSTGGTYEVGPVANPNIFRIQN